MFFSKLKSKTESFRYVPQNSLRHTTGGYISINSTKQAHYIRTQVPSQNWFWIRLKRCIKQKNLWKILLKLIINCCKIFFSVNSFVDLGLKSFRIGRKWSKSKIERIPKVRADVLFMLRSPGRQPLDIEFILLLSPDF